MATTRRSLLCDPEAPSRQRNILCEEETARTLCGVSRLDSSTSHAASSLQETSPKLLDSAKTSSTRDTQSPSTTIDEGHISNHPSSYFSGPVDYEPDGRTYLTDSIKGAIADGSPEDETPFDAWFYQFVCTYKDRLLLDEEGDPDVANFRGFSASRLRSILDETETPMGLLRGTPPCSVKQELPRAAVRKAQISSHQSPVSQRLCSTANGPTHDSGIDWVKFLSSDLDDGNGDVHLDPSDDRQSFVSTGEAVTNQDRIILGEPSTSRLNVPDIDWDAPIRWDGDEDSDEDDAESYDDDSTALSSTSSLSSLQPDAEDQQDDEQGIDDEHTPDRYMTPCVKLPSRSLQSLATIFEEPEDDDNKLLTTIFASIASPGTSAPAVLDSSILMKPHGYLQVSQVMRMRVMIETQRPGQNPLSAKSFIHSPILDALTTRKSAVCGHLLPFQISRVRGAIIDIEGYGQLSHRLQSSPYSSVLQALKASIPTVCGDPIQIQNQVLRAQDIIITERFRQDSRLAMSLFGRVSRVLFPRSF